jgi:hypothetical protein
MRTEGKKPMSQNMGVPKTATGPGIAVMIGTRPSAVRRSPTSLRHLPNRHRKHRVTHEDDEGH